MKSRRDLKPNGFQAENGTLKEPQNAKFHPLIEIKNWLKYHGI